MQGALSFASSPHVQTVSSCAVSVSGQILENSDRGPVPNLVDAKYPVMTILKWIEYGVYKEYVRVLSKIIFHLLQDGYNH